MALVCLCRGNFYWPPHTTILFCSIFLDKIVLDTLKSRYHRSAPLGILKVFNTKLIPIYIAPDVLTTRWSNMIKNGRCPTETLFDCSSEEV